MTVRRAGRLVLCMGTRSTFGEYGGCSSAAERARQVFGRSPCRPVRVRPSHITRAVLASRAPLGRRPSVTLVRRDDPTGKAKSAEPLVGIRGNGISSCERLRPRLGGGRGGFQLAFQLVFQLVDENDPGRPATYLEGCRASRAGH